PTAAARGRRGRSVSVSVDFDGVVRQHRPRLRLTAQYPRPQIHTGGGDDVVGAGTEHHPVVPHQFAVELPEGPPRVADEDAGALELRAHDQRDGRHVDARDPAVYTGTDVLSVVISAPPHTRLAQTTLQTHHPAHA